jgi:hypothetical protein
MKFKNYLAMILAFAMVVAAGYYLKVFAEGYVHYPPDVPNCTWCNSFYAPLGNYMGYDGCLVPDTQQAWCFWVQVKEDETLEIRWVFALCVLKDDETCELPCRHFTARIDCPNGYQFTGPWSIRLEDCTYLRCNGNVFEE